MRFDRFGLGIGTFDLDLASLCLLAFRQTYMKHAVLELCRRSLCGYCLRQGERPGERAVGPFDTMVVVLIGLLFKFALAGEREYVVLERKVEILSFHARQLGFEHERVFVLKNIDSRAPCPAKKLFAIARNGSNACKNAVHLILETA